MATADVQNQESGGSARGKINESIQKSNLVPDKMDKITTAQNGNIAIFNAAGQVIDSGEQLGGGSGSNIPEWNNSDVYPEFFVIQRGGKLFASKVDGNQGNEPPTEGENVFWRETSASESSSTPLWDVGVYNKERAEVYILDATVYKKYVLTVLLVNLPFESSDFAAELANGDWQLIGPSAGGGLTIQSQTPVAIADAATTDIVLNNEAVFYSFADGNTAWTITVSGGSDTEVKSARRYLDNSANNSVVIITLSDASMTINEDDGNNLSLAANSKYTLDVESLSATEVDILSIIPKK